MSKQIEIIISEFRFFFWSCVYSIYLDSFLAENSINNSCFIMRLIPISILINNIFEMINHFETFKELTKSNELSIEVWQFWKCNYKLTCIGIWSIRCHGKNIWLLIKWYQEVFIIKFATVNWVSSLSWICFMISTLRQ